MAIFPDPNVLLRITRDERVIAANADRISVLDLRGPNVDQARLQPTLVGGANGVAFSADGRSVASCGAGSLSLHELAGRQWSRVGSALLEADDGASTALACSGIALGREGRVAVAWGGSALMVYNPGRPIERIEVRPSATSEASPGSLCCTILGAALSDDGLLIAAQLPGSVEILPRTALGRRVSVPLNGSPARSGFSPNGQWLAVSTSPMCDLGRLSKPSRLYVVEAATGRIAGWRSGEDEERRNPQCAVLDRSSAAGELGTAGDTGLLDQASEWFPAFSSPPDRHRAVGDWHARSRFRDGALVGSRLAVQQERARRWRLRRRSPGALVGGVGRK